MFGHAVIGWRWLEQAIRAEQGRLRSLDNAEECAFYQGKLQAAGYFPDLGSARLSACPEPAGSPRRDPPGHAAGLVLKTAGAAGPPVTL